VPALIGIQADFGALRRRATERAAATA
jgi:hypothetical protein